MISSCPPAAAACRGNDPFKSIAFTLAPSSTSARTHSSRPLRHARCSAVAPACPGAVRSALPLHSFRSTSVYPLDAAMCTGRLLSKSKTSQSAPSFNNALTASGWFLCVACCSGVTSPFSLGWSTGTWYSTTRMRISDTSPRDAASTRTPGSSAILASFFLRSLRVGSLSIPSSSMKVGSDCFAFSSAALSPGRGGGFEEE
mmetsp:Transcript_6565/g.22074  ORF Transcript_6565/g.22074 Transcript_6565/m.22074 type:complete len:201 (+) Transcript_6565:1173-1775(+)